MVQNNSESSNAVIDRHQIDPVDYKPPTLFDIKLLSKLQHKNVLHIKEKRKGVDSLQVHYQVGELNSHDKYDCFNNIFRINPANF